MTGDFGMWSAHFACIRLRVRDREKEIGVWRLTKWRAVDTPFFVFVYLHLLIGGLDLVDDGHRRNAET
jgi:hypothetical protein